MWQQWARSSQGPCFSRMQVRSVERGLAGPHPHWPLLQGPGSHFLFLPAGLWLFLLPGIAAPAGLRAGGVLARSLHLVKALDQALCPQTPGLRVTRAEASLVELKPRWPGAVLSTDLASRWV